MKFSRIIFGAALAALAVAALVTYPVAVDHAQAATGLGVTALAMAGLVTIKAPVTVHHGGQFVAPGTEIEVTEEEARRLTAAHGAYGAAGEPDPANTQMRNVDKASIDALNEQTAIHKGTGELAKAADTNSDGKLSKSELNKLNKDDLITMAVELDVPIEDGATKPQIIDAILAAQDAAQA